MLKKNLEIYSLFLIYNNTNYFVDLEVSYKSVKSSNFDPALLWYGVYWLLRKAMRFILKMKLRLRRLDIQKQISSKVLCAGRLFFKGNI